MSGYRPAMLPARLGAAALAAPPVLSCHTHRSLSSEKCWDSKNNGRPVQSSRRFPYTIRCFSVPQGWVSYCRHADDRTNDSCDSFHNAASLPRWGSGAAQNVIDLFLVAKKEQRSVKAKSLSATLSIVRLCGHVSGLLLGRMSAGHFLQRQRKVTICALVQSASGLNVVLVVPLVMFSSTAHSTASV